MTHAEIISALGGPLAVAKALGIANPSTVAHWSRRGIPARYWLRLSKLPAADGETIPVETFEPAEIAA
jgi:hypothetical protein